MILLSLACGGVTEPPRPPPPVLAPAVERVPDAPDPAGTSEAAPSLRIQAEILRGEARTEQVMTPLRPRLGSIAACHRAAEARGGRAGASRVTIAWGPQGEEGELLFEGDAERDAVLRGCLRSGLEGLHGPPGVTVRYELLGEMSQSSPVRAPAASPLESGGLGVALASALRPCTRHLDPAEPGGQQRIVVILHRGSDGRVEHVEAELGTLSNDALRACVIKGVQEVELPPVRAESPGPERIPIVLARDEG